MKFGYKLIILPLILLATITSSGQNQSDFTLNSVVIDPGHGGKDPGTMSADKKTRESYLTLKISKLLAEKIRTAYPDMNVVLTREKDVYVDLIERAKIATKQNANLFISIHINAAKKNSTANGFSAYILGQSADKSKDTYAFNMEVVARENSVIYLEDDYSSKYAEDNSPEAQILMQFMYNAFREQSLQFAECVDDCMGKGPFRKSGGVHQANFCVLRQASMPAVLLELGFMSNAEDLKVLRREDSAEVLAQNIFKAFSKYKADYDKSVATEAQKPAAAPEQKAAPGTQSSPVEQKAAPARTENTPAAPVEQKAAPVKAGTPDAAAAEKKAEPVKTENPSAGEVCYGVQVLASSRVINTSDKVFKGYPCEVFKVGNLYKYILVLSTDKSTVSKSFVDISQKFPDSFCVKVENGVPSRCNIK